MVPSGWYLQRTRPSGSCSQWRGTVRYSAIGFECIWALKVDSLGVIATPCTLNVASGSSAQGGGRWGTGARV